MREGVVSTEFKKGGEKGTYRAEAYMYQILILAKRELDTKKSALHNAIE
jgi:hypothetical protein